MIENGVVDPDLPIDLATLCNSQFYTIDPFYHHYGVNLTDEGINNFKYKINIEVQHTTEPVIAKIEKNGGQIITAYFDKKSVIALSNPMEFFKKGFLKFIHFFKIFIFHILRPANTKKRVTYRRCF